MSLKNKVSLYDRHVRGNLGSTIERPDGEGPKPSEGNYFSIDGTSDSPFDTVRGPKMDQMVQLMTKDVLSANSQITYKSSPNQPNHHQDLNGVKGPIFGDASGEGKKLGGADLHEAMLTQAYTNNGVTVGPSPGPSGYSDFQDMNGSINEYGNGFANPETGNYMGRYSNPDTGTVY